MNAGRGAESDVPLHSAGDRLGLVEVTTKQLAATDTEGRQSHCFFRQVKSTQEKEEEVEASVRWGRTRWESVSGYGGEFFQQDLLTQGVHSKVLPHVKTDGANQLFEEGCFPGLL